MRDDGFRDLISHAHDRIERGHRLLKNHGDARTPQLAHGVVIESSKILRAGSVLCEQYFARDPGLRRQQPHDGERCDRFARPGFAD